MRIWRKRESSASSALYVKGHDMVQRTVRILLRLTPSEEQRIRQKMQQVGIRCRAAYIRKMAIDGYCIHLDIKDLKRVSFLLSNMANNLNQYAKQANTTGAIYKKDIDDLKQRQEEILTVMKEILRKLEKLQ